MKNYWYEQVKDSAPVDCVIALGATKIDIMCNEYEAREVYKESAELLARDRSLIFFDECSAKTGQNVDQVFYEMVQEIYDRQMEALRNGRVGISALKLKNEDYAQNYQERCCY
jgi:GTPase SAR1 family protein